MSGCGATSVNLEPAPDAANPVCSYAMVAMPEKLAGLEQRETTAQATTAWGSPAMIVLKCGVAVSEPVSDPCVEVNGIDWVLRPSSVEGDPAQAAAASSASTTASAHPSATATVSHSSNATQQATGVWTATTFGRTPSIEVTFDADKVSSSTLLTELNSAVKQIPSQKKCATVYDSLNGIPTGQ